MKSDFQVSTMLLMSVVCLSGTSVTYAQQTRQVAATAASNAQQTIERAAQEGKYTFLLFYKQSDNATKEMAATLTKGLSAKTEQAVIAQAQVGQTAEEALVAKYDVSRAPMPMTFAIAPNGAITGIFSQKVAAEDIENAFVTPTMMSVMKSLQEGRLALITVQGASKSPAAVAVTEFQADPHFKDRIVTISMTAADPLEAKFVGQMQIEPTTKVTHMVLLAPPGVLVGKFDAAASKDDIAAALAKAGKCCDDVNCKHHQNANGGATKAATRR